MPRVDICTVKKTCPYKAIRIHSVPGGGRLPCISNSPPEFLKLPFWISENLTSPQKIYTQYPVAFSLNVIKKILCCLLWLCLFSHDFKQWDEIDFRAFWTEDRIIPPWILQYPMKSTPPRILNFGFSHQTF